MPETNQQPSFVKTRNQYANNTIGDPKDAQPDLSQTMKNLRERSPILANQIDAVMASRSISAENDPKMWVSLHTQLTYTQKFAEASKNEKLYAPPAMPPSVLISSQELDSIRKEMKGFVDANQSDIADELEFGETSLRKPGFSKS